MSHYLRNFRSESRNNDGDDGNLNQRLFDLETIINTQNEMLNKQNKTIEEQKERLEAVEQQFKC